MITTRLGNTSDMAGVLKLQDQNLVSKMAPADLKYGFVTTPFTIEMIELMIRNDGLFIAEDQKQNIVAYVFAGNWEFYLQWEIFKVMTSRFPKLEFNNRNVDVKNSFQYGPICIDKDHRGQGIINLIFEEMRLTWLNRFDLSLTFINKANIISKEAHIKKLGWAIVDEFEFNDKTYLSLALDMTQSVL